MTKRIAIACFGLMLATGAGTVAAADDDTIASITSLDGKVLVNQGEEFQPAAKGLKVRKGDRIMAQNDSEAWLTYDDKCKEKVEENTILTVPDKSPCAGGVPLVQELNPAGGAAIGSATGATGAGNGGVAIMAGVVAAIDIWWLNEDDHDVVSP